MDARHCTYCQNLPALDYARRGATIRCPLCKGELFRTSDGATHRIPNGGVPARPGRRRFTLFTGAVACLLVGAAFTFHASRPGERLDPFEPTLIQTHRPARPAAVQVSDPKIIHDANPFAAVKGIGASSATCKLAATSPIVAGKRNTASDAVTTTADRETPLIVAVESWTRRPNRNSTYELLIENLSTIPEVTLTSYSKEEVAQTKNRRQIAEKMKKAADEIVTANRDDPDGFIKKVIAERNDLIGLPFRMGKECRLPTAASRSVATYSIATHEALDISGRLGTMKSPASASYDYRDMNSFAGCLNRIVATEEGINAALPALEQILAPEPPATRRAVLGVFSRQKSPAFSKYLIRLAIFDTDDSVRRQAVSLLASVKAEEYTSELIDAFRHPWLPAATHSAEAIVNLKRLDLVDRLEVLRRAPAPSAPQKIERGGKEELVVFDLVRINHHKNCFLCHPPATGQQVEESIRSTRRSTVTIPDEDVTVPVGLVPSPALSIPSLSGRHYYSGSALGPFVRADITYLKQDISALLPVVNADPWPTMQRFDVVVRTKTLTAEQASAIPMQLLDDTDAGEALRFALEELRKQSK